MENI
jgi:hypothetical protein